MTLRFLAATAALLTVTAAAATPAPSGTPQASAGSETPMAAKRYHFLLCRRDQGYGLGDWDWRYGSRAVRAHTRAPHPDFLLIQRDQSLFIITDAAVIKSASVALAPAEELGRRQGELDHQQGELGREQGALGRHQGDLGAKQADASSSAQQAELGRQQGKLGHQQGELGRRQGELGRRQGELGRLEAAAAAVAAEQLIPVFDAAFAQGKARPVADGP